MRGQRIIIKKKSLHKEEKLIRFYKDTLYGCDVISEIKTSSNIYQILI